MRPGVTIIPDFLNRYTDVKFAIYTGSSLHSGAWYGQHYSVLLRAPLRLLAVTASGTLSVSRNMGDSCLKGS